MNFLTIITFLMILCYIEAIDFCSPSLCKAGQKHVGCGNNGKFAAVCPKNAKMINLKPFIQQILHLHNSFRNRIAGGTMDPYLPAARMATVSWNKQLATVASFKAKECVMGHDQCRNTPVFKKSGQNLASRSSNEAKKKSIAFLINHRITAFSAEWKDANMAMVNSFPANHTGPKIGHFTTFVNQKCAYIGCAASRFTRDGKDTFMIVCNYSFINIVGKASYNVSTKAASGCKTGTNPHYPNLCSIAEVYDFN